MSDEAARPPECERLAAELRAVRERTGLSFAGLAERTPYSKSSWQRYLAGRGAIPRDAVASLCVLAGQPPGRLLALWELADAAWSGRARAANEPGTEAAEKPGTAAAYGPGTAAPEGPGAAAAQPPPGPERPPVPAAQDPAPARPLWRRGAVLAVAGALVVGAAVALPLALIPGSGGGADAGAADTGGRPLGASGASAITGSCRGETCEGKNPLMMGCGGQGMLDTLATHHGAQGQRLEVRYGRNCDTVWIRATGLRLGDRVRLAVPQGYSPEVVARTRKDTESYLATPMSAADPDTVKACLYHGGSKRPTCW